MGALTGSRLRVTAGLLLVAGILTAVSTRVLLGPPAPLIRIAWKNDSAGARRYLERQFNLTDAQDTPHGMWLYALRDTSASNIRALVVHPDVRRAEGIDPETHEVSSLAARASWRARWLRASESTASLFETAALTLVLIGGVLLVIPAAVVPILASRVREAILWLQRGVPSAAPEAAAAFRIAFGALVVLLVVMEPVRPAMLAPFALSRAEGPYGALVRWLAAHPSLVDALAPILAVTGALFVLGAATRVMFAGFTCAVLLWASVYTANTSTHAVAALELTLVSLLVARWGDAWSVDAWIRRLRGGAAPSASRAYGYAFWAPGLVLGVTFAAAAWSKVREGPGWILNGTVKYHFVSDLEHAWVSWGPWLTRWNAVAIAMGAAAVLIEALLITGMFSTRYAYRAALGAAAASLLVGFALFQGIVWLGWWVLLLSFLPWHLVGRADAPSLATSVRGITVAQVAAILLVIGQQLFITARHLEARPMFSKYDMYSTTYASPEDYEAASNLEYRVVDVSSGPASDLPGCVVDDRVAEIARGAAVRNADAVRLLKQAIAGCLQGRPQVRLIALEGDRQVFVWSESRFVWKRRLDVIGPIDAELLRR